MLHKRETNDMLNYFNHFKYTRFNKSILFCVGNNTPIFINGSTTYSKFEWYLFSDIKMAQL